jgi:hypothetical protein
MSLIMGLFACHVRTLRDLLRLGVLSFGVLICSIGLYPFVTSAAHVSGAENVASGLGPIVSLLPRVIAHPANMVSPPAAFLFFVSLVILIAISFAGIATALWHSPSHRLGDPLIGVAVALLSGLLVTFCASRLVHGFDPLKPSYSGWMLPFIAILASSAVERPRWWGSVIFVCLICTASWGEYVFLSNARFFVHGPERSINEALGGDPASSSIVYVGAGWPYGYFPLWYQYRGRVAQWLLSDDGQLHRITKGGGIENLPSPFAVLNGSKRVVVVAIQTRTYQSLIKHDGGDMLALNRAALLVASRVPRMHLDSEYNRPGLYWSELAILRKSR